jgi:hypothetical protein
LIPRSAALQAGLGFILQNLIWNGISFKECRKPTSYQHWRIPHRQQTLLEKSLSNPAFEFIESITLQEPWINKLSFNPNEIILKNLRWPGFIFSLNGIFSTNCYFGTGIITGEHFVVEEIHEEEEHLFEDYKEEEEDNY